MRHPVQDHVAVLDSKHRPPVALPQSEGARRASKRNDIGMAFSRCFSNSFETIEQSLRFGSGQTGKLLEHLRRNDQGHAARSLTASVQSRRPVS